jgi:hypothetical protein
MPTQTVSIAQAAKYMLQLFQAVIAPICDVTAKGHVMERIM